MTVFVDTNVLVRHFTGDPPGQARRATSFLSSVEEIVLVDVVVAELVYVLESFYEAPRDLIAQIVRGLVTSSRVAVADEDLLLRTIEVYERHRLAFADAYLIASAERHGGAVASFDRGIDRVGTVTRQEP